MNKIVAGTWVEFLKDYQGAKAQDQCKVLCNIQGGLYVTNQRGGQIYSLESLKSRGIIKIMSDYDTDVATLAWQHNRSALVHLMLLEGYKYIMCEIGEEDKSYLTVGQETPRFIVDKYEEGCFIDVEGNMWQHSQAINSDGTVMTYDDYLMLRQLKENKCD